MKTTIIKFKKDFFLNWMIAVGFSWPISLILAIILSYLIINPFYPKETNLIVGLCLGGTTGFAQWILLKKYFKISIWWIFASAIGIGVPVALIVISEEMGIVLPEPLNNENVSIILSSCIGGLLTGLLQMPILKSVTKYAVWWIPISTFCWGIAMFPGIFIEGFILVIGGVILAALSGYSIMQLLKFPKKEMLN